MKIGSRSSAADRTGTSGRRRSAGSKSTTLADNGGEDDDWFTLETSKKKSRRRAPLSTFRFNEPAASGGSSSSSTASSGSCAGSRASASSQEQWETMSGMTSWRRLAQGRQCAAGLPLKFDRLATRSDGSEKLIVARPAQSGQRKCQLHSPLDRIIMSAIRGGQPEARAHLHGNRIITAPADTRQLWPEARPVQCETMTSSSTIRSKSQMSERAGAAGRQLVDHKPVRAESETNTTTQAACSQAATIRRRVPARTRDRERSARAAREWADDAKKEASRNTLRQVSRGSLLARVCVQRCAKTASMWASWRKSALLLAGLLLLTSLLASLNLDLLRRPLCSSSSPGCLEQRRAAAFSVSAAVASGRPPLKRTDVESEPLGTERSAATLSAPTLASTPASKSNASGASEHTPANANKQATGSTSLLATMAASEETASSTPEPALQAARQAKPKKSIQLESELSVHKQQAAASRNMHNSSAIKSSQSIGQDSKWQAIVAHSNLEAPSSGQEASGGSASRRTFAAQADKPKVARPSALSHAAPADIVIGRRPGVEANSPLYDWRGQPQSYMEKVHNRTQQPVPSSLAEAFNISSAAIGAPQNNLQQHWEEPFRSSLLSAGDTNEQQAGVKNSRVSQTLSDWTVDSSLSGGALANGSDSNNNNNLIIPRQHISRPLSGSDNVRVSKQQRQQQQPANGGQQRSVEQLAETRPLEKPLASVLREALDDLATSAAGDQLIAAAGRQSGQGASERPLQQQERPAVRSQFHAPLVGPLLNGAQPGLPQAASAPLLSQLPLLDLRHFRQTLAPFGEGLVEWRGSQSAPSIALPPISHLLSPRNPFRLFASASTPVSTRYWPVRHLSTGGGGGGGGGQTSKQPRRWFGAGSAAQSGRASKLAKSASVGGATGSAATNANPLQGPFSALNDGRELLSLQDVASSSMSSSWQGPALYAQSQSAEQLEKLVRAASQAGQLTGASPIILPAIVSGLDGQTFPGFYIPAIEPPAESSGTSAAGNSGQESQVSELIRHHAGHAASASTQSGAAATLAAPGASLSSSNGLISTIPGTDYILHPDEVRAMIDIGESAWRQRQQQDERARGREGSQAAASNLEQHQLSGRTHHESGSMFHAGSSPFEPLRRPIWPQAANLMQENHLENLRNYAYVEPTEAYPRDRPPSSSAEGLQGASSANRQQGYAFAQPENATSLAARQLGDQLNRALARAQSRNLPAIIRVNDQDYVHWPLIQMRAPRAQRPGLRPGEDALTAASVTQKHEQQQQQMLAQAMQQQDEIASPTSNLGSDQLDQPVRTATQLTPHEIRQVEDSILETLIMAQTIGRQRKIMEALAAAASQPQAQLVAPNAAKWRAQNSAQKPRNGFFSRRRRRRNSATHKGQPSGRSRANEGREQRLAPLGSSQHLVGLVPLMSGAPLALHPFLRPGLASFSGDARQTEAMMSPLGRNEQARGESQVVQRLPNVMADQETNKPQASGSSAEQLMQAADSTGGARSAATHLTRQVFGARVSSVKGQTSPGATGAQLAQSDRGHTSRPGQQAALASTPLGPSSFAAKDQYVTFVPVQNNRARQISLYQGARQQGSGAKLAEQPGQAGESGLSQMVASSSSSGANRINVDWPAMVSDADYFPSGQQRAVNGLQPISSNGPPMGAMSSQASRLRPAGSSLASKKSFLLFPSSDDELEHVDAQRLPDEQIDRRLPRPRPQSNKKAPLQAGATLSIIQPEATRRGNLVSSQMKLQFAQDYQAREGVPIYNNNVRAAGALDRQRSLEAAAARTQSMSAHESSGDDADESVLVINRTQSPKLPQASKPTSTTA